LVLAIVPLSTITWYATRRERQDIQREVTAKLSSVATIVETQVLRWVKSYSSDLDFVAGLPTTQESVSKLIAGGVGAETAGEVLRAQLEALQAKDPAFEGLTVLDNQGQVLASTELPTNAGLAKLSVDSEANPGSLARNTTLNPSNETGLLVTEPIIGPDKEPIGLLTGWLNLEGLAQTMQATGGLGEIGEVYLVDAQGFALPQGHAVTSPGIQAALSGENTAGLQDNYSGIPVIGVYRWIPELELALVAEQAQEASFAVTDTVIAAVVSATLVVALVTAVIAAIVTRQITRPIVRLTESALRIADGDMEQRVPVTSRDEIGILAYVFNHMAAELKALYDDLERKVAERTALLQKANYQIQRRAIQMATTIEVSQAATSILEPDPLLHQVVRLIHDSFAYFYVGIYLMDDDGKRASLREHAGGERVATARAKPVLLTDAGAVGRTLRTAAPSIVRGNAAHAQELFASPYVRAEAALPLRMGDQIIGVLDILSTDPSEFNEDDVSVLQNVANQIAIALENARAYAVEREAAKRLRELDRSKRRFLANMSHELRTPLTNIIGFSRLMLKGIDGPLSQQARQDVEIIYHNGQHLVGLIDDLLDISHIEAGLMELEFREVNLSQLIHSVMATASALVRDKDIELHQEVTPNLPNVQADAVRVRQVLLRLLANAAKFTEHGTITVRSWPDSQEVFVSVKDTGVGIAPEDQERIFEQFEQGSLENGRRPNGAGLGLALSKEFVELHGGRIWVESEPGQGSTFTFTLPLHPSPSSDRRMESGKGDREL
jgi:signal transduction histidine kinase/HAMP domain-containing protein